MNIEGVEHVRLESDLTHADLLRVFVEAAYRKGYVEGIKSGCAAFGVVPDLQYLVDGVNFLRVEWYESDDGNWVLGAKFPEDAKWFDIIGIPASSYANSVSTPAFRDKVAT